MATEIKKPTPPPHLTKAAALRWTKLHDEALAQARQDMPDDERSQRVDAIKAANRMLKIVPPANHAEAAKLVESFKSKDEDGWKVIAHGTRVVDEQTHLFIVTADGRKHLFPMPAAKPAETKAADSKPADKKPADSKPVEPTK